MCVIIIMVIYFYAIFGMEFFNTITNPPVYQESPYYPKPYINFNSFPMALLTLF